MSTIDIVFIEDIASTSRLWQVTLVCLRIIDWEKDDKIKKH